jgi:predicted kinase
MNGKTLTIMRGAPGSGKSFKAKQLAKDGVICSADDFFMELGKGQYQFNPSLLPQAHKQCQDKALQAINSGISPVVIDNTNTSLWELKQLKHIIQTAKSLGYSVNIEEPETDWWKNKDIDEMAKRNSHGVPRNAIEKMINRFENNVKVEDILKD